MARRLPPAVVSTRTAGMTRTSGGARCRPAGRWPGGVAVGRREGGGVGTTLMQRRVRVTPFAPAVARRRRRGWHPDDEDARRRCCRRRPPRCHLPRCARRRCRSAARPHAARGNGSSLYKRPRGAPPRARRPRGAPPRAASLHVSGSGFSCGRGRPKRRPWRPPCRPPPGRRGRCRRWRRARPPPTSRCCAAAAGAECREGVA